MSSWRSRRDIFTIDALLALRTLPVAERISLETRRRGYMLTHRTCEDTVFGGARPSNVKRLTGGVSAASTHTPLSIYTHIERKKGDPIERQTDRQTDRQKRGGGHAQHDCPIPCPPSLRPPALDSSNASPLASREELLALPPGCPASFSRLFRPSI